jgi:GTP-binding protein
LVGLPNAGKSSLLSRLTRAAPKVADYPFTTVEPVLGTIDDGERQLVLADIPGLIEGAADGAGLGHEFLAHVERCRVLVHLLEIGPDADPEEAYRVVRGELTAHGHGLDRLPEIIALSKADLLPPEDLEPLLAEWRERVPGALSVRAISSAASIGLEELVGDLFAAEPPAEMGPGDADADGFESEFRLYRPGGAAGYEAFEVEDGVFEINGRGIEMLVERHDLANPEAVAYLERRLTEIGVIKALRKAGFEDGDEVRIGEFAFDLHPAD